MMLAPLLLALSATAYEADTLTDRHLPLPDVTDALDARTQESIDLAIETANRRTGCDGDVERARDLVSRIIHRETASDEMVLDRGGLRAFGFDRYSAWIEKGGVPRRDFQDRRDLFGSTSGAEAPLLRWAGVASTVRVNDVLIGTDKLDHFFEEGYDAWRRSRGGLDLAAAVAWATFTENTRYGLKTSETFSFGDLKADFDGMMFYASLVTPGSVVEMGDDGCLTRGVPFTWRDWVNWEYDEVLNPSVHTPSAQRGVDRHLALYRESYCASYEMWADDDYLDHLDDVLATLPHYASEAAPPRSDPYELEALCDGIDDPIPEPFPRGDRIAERRVRRGERDERDARERRGERDPRG
jgi:hypothetical protein